MTAQTQESWQTDFGLADKAYPGLFTSKAQLGPRVPQAHVLRHAFEQFDLDGILCIENQPLIYFKQTTNARSVDVTELHRRFWNHGGAPILALISPTYVQIFSGMLRPTEGDLGVDTPGLVETINRVADELQRFLVAVETGAFFQRHRRAFDPDQRVDRDLLSNLKATRHVLTGEDNSDERIDALLCRLVFTCYLFDRGVIDAKYVENAGLPSGLTHLRDLLAVSPARDAKNHLYVLFQKLGEDFNGDLFSGDLAKEARGINVNHIRILNDFFHGTEVISGQRSFWPYDFGYIPIEAISAIYEHFLGDEDQSKGAFYTPRFLVELVLESALRDVGTLIGKRFLDPACGSGIFLVGLFNRLAEEWTQKNPTARNERRARELIKLMQDSLYGIDINSVACRITAFSLYLAYLDKLAPRDIQGLQAEGRALPNLMVKPDTQDGNIFCADFFASDVPLPEKVDIVVGNPPWGSLAGKGTPAASWCNEHKRTIPDKQIANAFMWKAPTHMQEGGRVCFVLPHGTLFNHSRGAVDFQKSWAMRHRIEWVLNLADLRFFLFSEAIHPAIVVSYAPGTPRPDDLIEYLAPKADWQIMLSEVVTVASADRSTFSVGELLSDLKSFDAPQLWTQRFWGSPRDLRLLDRLSLLPRLRDRVARPSDGPDTAKPWVIAEGYQPFGASDDKKSAKEIVLPSNRFIAATSDDIDLFLLPADCQKLPRKTVELRGRSNTNVIVFKSPHVLIGKGFHRIAFADFDVAFRHALRGIHGPEDDAELLAFLAAYLRTPLAQFYVFHTSSNWGIYRPEVHVQELLRLPLPLPDDLPDAKRARTIVRKAAQIVALAAKQANEEFLCRDEIVRVATRQLEPLVYEYFGITEAERVLIEDTIAVITPSIQPSYTKMPVPSVEPVTSEQRGKYVDRICKTLNAWAKCDAVQGHTLVSSQLGIAIAVLERLPHRGSPARPNGDAVMEALVRLRNLGARSQQALLLPRDVMVFDHTTLYLVKSIGHRFWTESAALNDADQVASTLLMRRPGGDK